MGHEPQEEPQEQEDFPLFLSLIILNTTSPIIIATAKSTAIEPRFSLRKLINIASPYFTFFCRRTIRYTSPKRVKDARIGPRGPAKVLSAAEISEPS